MTCYSRGVCANFWNKCELISCTTLKKFQLISLHQKVKYFHPRFLVKKTSQASKPFLALDGVNRKSYTIQTIRSLSEEEREDGERAGKQSIGRERNTNQQNTKQLKCLLWKRVECL